MAAWAAAGRMNCIWFSLWSCYGFRVWLLAAQGVQVTVLAVTGDGLPEPAEARYRFRVLDGRVGAVVRVPFIPAFRLAADPLAVTLPRRARHALAEIRALAGQQP